MRDPAVQRSPLREKTPKMVASMAASRSASAKTTAGDLPPSSMDRPFRYGAALREDDLAGAGLAGEGDQRHVRVLDQRVAGEAFLAVAVDEVEDALGQAGLLEDARPQGRGQRGELGRLQHHGVAGGQCRAELPGLEHERGVPRRDEPGDADRLAVDVVGLAAGHLEGVVVLGDDQVGEEAEVLGRARAWPSACLIGSPVSKHSSSASSWLAGLDDVGDLVQHAGALARQHRAATGRSSKASLARRRRPRSTSAFLPAAALHVRLVGDRVQHVEGVAVDRVDELAVDVVLQAGGQVGRDKVLGHDGPFQWGLRSRVVGWV